MIHFRCPECGVKLRGKVSRSGRKRTCPCCGGKVLVPAASEPSFPEVSIAAEDSSRQPDSSSKLADATRNGAGGSSVVIPSPEGLSPEDSSFLDKPQAAGEIGRLGQFRVLEMIGSGATGIVFRAEDTVLKRTVALKVLRPATAASPESRRRFLREARAAAAFDHDHILTIHQVGEDRGVPWLAMKLLRGQSLKDRLGGGANTLPTDQLLRIGAEIADALAAAHAGGLVHRDVKPSNILLEESTERVKLIDFGLALVNDDEGQLTRTGCVVGTPTYMAPEQADGIPVDHRSDLYALGCVLYRCVTGRLPFEGQTFMQVFYAQRMKDVVHPREIVPTIPEEVAEIIMKLLAKDASQRPQSALEVRDQLRSLRARLAAQNSQQQSETLGAMAALETQESQVLPNPWAEVLDNESSETNTLIRSSSTWQRARTVPNWLWAVIAASVGLLFVAMLLATRH
jgi:serine/threonine protein kinase